MATKGPTGTNEQLQHRNFPGNSGAHSDVDNPDAPGDRQQHLDRLIARMQTPAHRKAVEALFASTPKELGAAAVAAARATRDSGSAKK